ncbi:MAG: DNA-processing protein DprA [Planctomycetaceae bacterium]
MSADTDHGDPDPSESELRSALALSLVNGVGPRLQTTLLKYFGTPQQVLEQPVAVLMQVHGVGKQVAERIASPLTRTLADVTLQQARDLGVSVLMKGQAGYPAGLFRVDDSPLVLFCRGTLLPQDDLAVAIVGSRRCTAYGRRQAERLAGSLARAGFTIVSGLARGIDGAAHRAALAAGGRTIGVLASGVKEIYPPEHADLAMDVMKQGALVSEFALETKPRPGLFPQRNRIISALSLGVIVVEANRSSGALYTARHAMEQGRDVFAVPGPVDSLASEGCHDLIRDGVTLIRHADDVLQELAPLTQPAVTADSTIVHDARELTLNPQEREILNHISTSPVHVDQLIAATQLELSRVLSTLTILELKRFIRRLPGNMLVRNV